MPTESAHLEFKEAKLQYDYRKLCKYCVGMANEGGGILLLGIADKLPRKVVGTQAFADVRSLAMKLFDDLGFRVEAGEIKHPDGRVVAFEIPSRPRGTAYHLEGVYLMRSGDRLVVMSEDQLRRIFAEGRPDWLEENTVTGISVQDVVELLDTQTFFELLKRPYPKARTGVIDRLRQERLISSEAGKYSISRLGALLLAKRLNDFHELARKAPRVVVYSGTTKLNTRLDQTVAKGYAVGFQELIRLLMAQLPQNEVLKDALRKEVRLLPETAVRELAANALIHQDLMMTGVSVMLEVYDNRLEISNPGEPIVPVERFIDGYQSRNERMANLMRRMGICEEKSSGIDRVVLMAEEFQLPAPDFRYMHSRTLTILYGPKKFSEMDRDDRIRACYQHCALKWVMSETMTNQSLRERFRVSEGRSAIISQIIGSAIEANLVKADEKKGGSRKFARYLPFWA